MANSNQELEASSFMSDPLNLASHFFAYLKLVDVMAEEFKEIYGAEGLDVHSQIALQKGFKGMKSKDISFIVETSKQLPLSLVLFHKSEKQEDAILKDLAFKILDIFIYKYKSRLLKGNYLRQYQNFAKALSLIYEDVSAPIITY